MEVDPNPTPTKTGPDYETGIVYGADGTIASYMPTRVLTAEDGTVFYAQPTQETYHRQDSALHPGTAQDITQMYIDNFEWTPSALYSTYAEYPYEQMSEIISRGYRKGACWAFTSPFTGIRYTGVLPFYCLYFSDDLLNRKQWYMWFVEIFNDYMAYRGFAPYDPLEDGIPNPPRTNSKLDWYGMQPFDTTLFVVKSRPPHLYDTLPKLVGPGPTYYAHFEPAMFVNRQGVLGNPRRNAKHSAIQERDPPVAVVDESYDEDAVITLGELDGALLYTTPKFDFPTKPGPPWSQNTDSYSVFGDWDLNFNREQDPVGIATDGGTFPMYYKDVEWSLIQDRLNRGTNVTGALVRVSGQANGVNVFEVYFNTRDQTGIGFSRFGRVMTGDNLTNGSTQVWQYQSKWLYQTVDNGQPYFRPTDSSWLTVPNADRCFAGVCWDGTAIANFQSGEWLQNGRGVRAWGSPQYVNTVQCKSNATDPTTEFAKVLAVAKANVFESTGRHQCPFTWHSTLGYIAYHMMM